MSKLIFSRADLEKIKEAVKEAERQTSGEIATAFVRESDNYAFYELMFGLFAGFFYFVAMLFFAQRFELRMLEIFWGYSSSYLVMAYGFTTFIVIALAYLAANLNFIDRLIIPKMVMATKVNQRAVRHFIESGVYNTKERNGVLIFISSLERRVEIVADRGLSAKIPKNQWDHIVAHIVDGIHTNQLAKHLSEAILECGKLMSEHFPVQPDDVNELDDNIQLLRS